MSQSTVPPLYEQRLLKDFFADAPHPLTFSLALTIEEWTAAGSPYNLFEVERNHSLGIIVFAETSYGRLLAIAQNKVYSGKYEIILPNAVILDTDYYAASKYIWT